jgi:hypothetical protein
MGPKSLFNKGLGGTHFGETEAVWYKKLLFFVLETIPDKIQFFSVKLV